MHLFRGNKGDAAPRLVVEGMESSDITTPTRITMGMSQTVLEHNPMMSECDFCREFAGIPTNQFAQVYGAEADRLVDSSSSLNAIPSMGQLVEGHMLVIPKRHTTAFADLRSDELREVDEVVGRCGAIIERLYGPFVMFEHGTRNMSSGGCGVLHAHLHLVPCKPELRIPSELKMRPTVLATFEVLPQAVSRTESYLLFRDQQKRTLVTEVGYLPSQYFRKIVANALGIPEWDWRVSPFQDSLFRTVERIKAASTVG